MFFLPRLGKNPSCLLKHDIGLFELSREMGGTASGADLLPPWAPSSSPRKVLEGTGLWYEGRLALDKEPGHAGTVLFGGRCRVGRWAWGPAL